MSYNYLRHSFGTRDIITAKNASPNGIEIRPQFKDFQLIGDSLLVRFADKILHQPNRMENGSRALGYCVSGQRIDQLRKKIKGKSYPLSSNVMVLIGTNDILCNGNYDTMVQNFNRLLKLLRKKVEKLLILTLPPIPKLCLTYYHWVLIRRYNSYLKALDNGRNILVADICPIFTRFDGALNFDLTPFIPSTPQSEKTTKSPFLLSAATQKSDVDNTEDKKTNVLSNVLIQRRSRELVVNRRSCGRDKRFPKPKINIARNEYTSESDYKTTSDTNTSFDSEVLSSELSQDLDFKETPTSRKGIKRVVHSSGSVGLAKDGDFSLSQEGRSFKYRKIDWDSINSFSKTSRSYSVNQKPENSPTPRLFVNCITNVLREKEKMNNKVLVICTKEKKVKNLQREEVKPKETELHLSSFTSSGNFFENVDSDEDSWGDHVYMSQDEVNYNTDDTEDDQTQSLEKDGFLKYVDALQNAKDLTPRRSVKKSHLRNSTILGLRNESESSATSDDDDVPKRQMLPYIDDDFLNFVKNSCNNNKRDSYMSKRRFSETKVETRTNRWTPNYQTRKEETQLSVSPFAIFCQPPPPPPPLPPSPLSPTRDFRRSWGSDQLDNLSERDKAIVFHSEDVCRLEYYERLYRFGNKRIDMIHLNYSGLNKVKDYLVDNSYI